MRLLMPTFFLRSIDTEGVGCLLDSIAMSFCDLGVDTTILAPMRYIENRPYRVVNFLMSTHLGYFKRISSYIRNIKKMSKDYDIIHILENNPAFSLFDDIISTLNKNTFVTIATPAQKLLALLEGNISKQYLLHCLAKNRIWTKFSSFKCRKYIVSTEFQRKQLLSLGVPQDKLEVIPFGINPRKFEPYDRDKAKEKFELKGRKVISYLGHFSPMKGVPDLIAAFGQVIVKNSSDVTLALAWSGKGAESKKVFGLIKKLNLKDRVKIFGKVDVRKFLAVSDMIVLPYIHDSIAHFPLVMIEAFAMGVPVVSTDVGGISEMVKDNQTGLLVPPQNVKRLASAIQRLLDDSQLCERISKNERKEFIEKYNSDVIVKRYLKLYEENL